MQFHEWLKENLGPDIPDLAEYGAEAGFPHLTYYSDTDQLYREYESEIYQALREDTDAMGYDNVEQFVSTFNRTDMLEFPAGRRCLLVWYLAERTARNIVAES